MILRFLFAVGAGAGCWLHLGAEPPAPFRGPALARPWTGFDATEASRFLTDLAFREREVRDLEVVVVAPDDRRQAQEIGTSTKRQALVWLTDRGRSPGHQRLYLFMRHPSGMYFVDRGMTDYGCLFPSSAPLP